jgi:hypothetical protein
MVDKCLLSNKRTERVIRYWRGVVCCPQSAQRDLPSVSVICQAFVGSRNQRISFFALGRVSASRRTVDTAKVQAALDQVAERVRREGPGNGRM